MKSLRILIVDDDQHDAIKLKDELTSIGHNVLGIATNAMEALDYFKQQEPTLAILDVQLKNSKLNGIDIMKSFNQIKKIPIIFINGTQNFDLKIKAIQTDPAYYLDKPWHPDQLKGAISFALHNFKKGNFPISESDKKQLDCYKMGEFFFIRNNERFERIDINEIVIIKAANSCVEIITEKERMVFYTNLRNFFQQIDHPNLMRIHRSFAINIQNVFAFNSGTAYIKKGNINEEIPIGNTYKDEFNNFFYRLKSD